MNQEWQDFLVQQGAHVEDGIVHDFGNFNAELQSARDGSILCDLGQFGLIRVNGEEAQKFLQSLLSNDITAVNAHTSQFSSFNSAKGRMLATFLIWQQDADYLLHLPRSLVASMQKKLAMYVLRAKVKVSDASDEMVCLGVAGNAAAGLLEQHCAITLPQAGATGYHAGVTAIRISSDRYLVCTSVQQASALWRKLAETARPAGSPGWDWLNIRDGIPVVTPATQEQFVLQMANLDLLNGVSFKKGCYPGQEIVARTHYLGKQKRRMYRAHVETETAPAAGNELFSSGMPGQSCGMVLNAAAAPAGGYDLLAVMQISSHEAGNVHLLSAAGAALQFQPLPYSLPVEQ